MPLRIATSAISSLSSSPWDGTARLATAAAPIAPASAPIFRSPSARRRRIPAWNLQAERSLEPGSADDDAVDAELADGFDVCPVADTAGGEHLAVVERPHLAKQLEIRA